MSDYKGWTNKATWLVNVWYNPESESDMEYAEEHLEETLSLLGGSGCAHDMLNDTLADVNWQELREHFEPDECEEVQDEVK